MEPIHYLDFELKISGGSGQYHAEVLRSPGGKGSLDFKLPFGSLEMENLLLRMTRLRRASRRIDSPELDAARQLGGKLFQAVFQSAVHDCLRSSLDKASEQPQTGLRVKLHLQNAPELVNVPWEFLYDQESGRFLAQSVQTPVVRYIEPRERIKPLRAEPPLRILGMVSNPTDYGDLKVRDEQERLQSALAPLIQAGMVQVTWLPDATLSDLHQMLQSGEYHVFHFIGHGGFDLQTEQGVLVLRDEHGRGWYASAERLGVLLHDHRSLRLAVLNSCEGARGTAEDPFASMAANLVRQSIPAVVAMQFEISDRSAITFAEYFYAALAQGYPVDASLAEARKAIYFLPEDVEWGTPVLYLCAADGVLFDLAVAPHKVPAADAITTFSPLELNDQATARAWLESLLEKQGAAGEDVAIQVGDRLITEPGELVEILGGTHPAARKSARQKKAVTATTRVVDPEILAALASFIRIPERHFWIAKYLVTNEQYMRFLASPDFAERELWVDFPRIGEPPGYQKLVTWGDKGWKWLQSQLEDNKVIVPLNWGDGEFGIARQKAPVVSLTWYEANAYCKWLLKHWTELAEGAQNPQLKPVLVRLPTEAEWVFAAGGEKPDKRYPWDMPGKATRDVQEIIRRANVKESQIGRTTAVDAYPQGASQPYGLLDMAGNVWEWQANYFDKNNTVLALRGGSWDDECARSRVSVRLSPHPHLYWPYGGFRVMALPE